MFIAVQVSLPSNLPTLYSLIQLQKAEWADDEKMIPQATTLLTFLQVLGGVAGVA